MNVTALREVSPLKTYPLDAELSEMDHVREDHALLDLVAQARLDEGETALSVDQASALGQLYPHIVSRTRLGAFQVFASYSEQIENAETATHHIIEAIVQGKIPLGATGLTRDVQFYAYCTAAGRNTTRDNNRRQANDRARLHLLSDVSLTEALGFQGVPSKETTEEAGIARVMADTIDIRVETAFRDARLTPRQRELIRLRIFEELSYEEISDLSGQNINALTSAIYRALQSIKERQARTPDGGIIKDILSTQPVGADLRDQVTPRAQISKAKVRRLRQQNEITHSHRREAEATVCNTRSTGLPEPRPEIAHCTSDATIR